MNRQRMTSLKTATCLSAVLLLAQLGDAFASPHFGRRHHNATTAANASADVVPTSDTLGDYAYRMDLNVAAQGVLSLRLPQAVYLHAQSAALNDVRLFDADGAQLAFALHVPTLQSHVLRRQLPVKIFPVMSNRAAPNAGDDIAVDIRTAGDGTVLSVRSKAGGSGKNTRLTSLVLDLRQTTTPAAQSAQSAQNGPRISALQFSLPADSTAYSAQVWLEVSDDLKQWDTIGTSALNWLFNSSTETLSNDRMEFEPRSFRYARLSWHKGEPIQFASITAESTEYSATAPAIDTLTIQPTPGKHAQDLVYPAALAIPVERISLQFSEQNIVYPASLGYYDEIPSRQIGQPTVWRFQPEMQTTFYQITQDGKTRRSGDINVPRTHSAQWVLRPQAASSAKPTMTITWQPANLIFVTSGKDPYTLAFGRNRVTSNALALAQVAPGFGIDELQKLPQASAGPVQQQAARPESEAAIASASAKQRSLILWGVLLLGVLVLGAMVWSLVKQMQQKK
jgi:hypothetical protein